MCIPADVLSMRPESARSLLNSNGAGIATPKQLHSWLGCFAEVKHFPDADVIEHQGWSGRSYLTAEGVLHTPTCSQIPFTALSTKAPDEASAQPFRHWIGRFLPDLPIITFGVLVAFAGPLIPMIPRLKGIGFNIIGPAKSGKTSLLGMVASLCGASGTPRSILSLADFDRNAIATLARYRDQITLIDRIEVGLAGETSRRQTEQTKKMLEGLSRPNGGASLYLVTSQLPISKMFEGSNNVIGAAAQNLLEIDCSSRPLGIFDEIPHPFDSASHSVTEFQRRFATYGPAAMSLYLDGLLERSARDSVGLARLIESYITQFKAIAGINLNDGVEVADADSFGILFAAGMLAQSFRVLHDRIDLGAQVMSLFRGYLDRSGECRFPFAQRLARIVSDVRTIEVVDGRAVDSAQATAARAFRKARNGYTEVWIKREQIKSVFTNWEEIKNTQEVSRLWLRDDHQTTWRSVGKGNEIRVFCFRIDNKGELEE